MVATLDQEIDVDLRGAPWALMAGLEKYRGEPKIIEALIEGPARTGKSRGVGYVLLWAMIRWPGIRILVVRKTRKSLNESFLQTWEDEVLPPTDPMRDGRKREDRDSYTHPNGSTMALGGLDHPTRLFSTQYDIVYAQEAFELTQDEWEKFLRPLCHWNGKATGHVEDPIPFQLLVGDTNPDAETHWLNRRCEPQDGKPAQCMRLVSRHRDNPFLWSKQANDWTPEGRAYMQGLDGLHGVRRRRLRDGVWCSAEGAVWETYDRAVHLIDRPADLKRDLGIRYFVGSVDWGFSDPGVFQVWGITGDRRAYRVAEWYSTNALMEWWVEQICGAVVEFEPFKVIVCDPENKSARVSVNVRLSKMGKAPIAIAADNARHSQNKGDLVGLDLVRERFAQDKDGKSHIYLLRDSLRCRDDELILNSRPTCLEQEIPSYTFLIDESGKPTKERTDPACADHACDAMRYMAQFMWRRDLSPRAEQIKPKLGTLASFIAQRNPEAAQEWIELDETRRIAAEQEMALAASRE